MNGEFNLRISLGNLAMQDNYDVAEALCRVSKKVENGQLDGSIMDLNGNNVGFYQILTEEDIE